MKHKVGDKVKIKSLEWYEANKNEKGHVFCGEGWFLRRMACFCGKTYEVKEVRDDFYALKRNKWFFTDEMFEDEDYFELIERDFISEIEAAESITQIYELCKKIENEIIMNAVLHDFYEFCIADLQTLKNAVIEKFERLNKIL